MNRFANWPRAGLCTSCLLLLLALVAGPTSLAAQTQSRLNGTVTDTSGAVIPGAPVTATNVETGVAQTAETNESGGFIFPYLTPGSYSLKVEYAGFKTYSQSGITIETGATRSVTIALEVGEVTEVVTVEADVPLLESSTSSVTVW